jgi:hypothetical protein
VRTIGTLLLCLLLGLLSAQSVDDPEFRLPPGITPGEVDISRSFKTKGIQNVKLFDPEGIRRANMVLLMEGGSFDKDVDAKDGGIDVYRMEFDENGRPVSERQLIKRGYDIIRDMYVGFHIIDLRYEYRDEGRVEINYLDSKEGIRYVWYFLNDRIQRCEFFSGRDASLTAYWLWDYESESFLSDFKKFDYLNRLEYHFKYAYDENGRLNHILKTFANGDMRVSIYETEGRTEVIRHYEMLKDAYRDCYQVMNGLLMKDGNCAPPRRSKANKDVRHYNAEGMLVKIEINSGTSSQPEILEFDYNEAGDILREIRENNFTAPVIIQYTYDGEGKLIKIEYLDEGGRKVREKMELEYDERGNVIRCFLTGIIQLGNSDITDRVYRSDTIPFEMDYRYFE